MQSFKELQIWQLGMELARSVYSETKAFPRKELYGLTAQMRRAAVSVPSNIAEGHIRRVSSKEFSYFLKIALGSLAELETQLLLARDFGYMGANEQIKVSGLIDSMIKMVRSMNKKVTT